MSEAGQVRTFSRVEDDTVIILDAAEPVRATATLAPMSVGAAQTVSGPAVILAAAAPNRFRVPVPEGYPTPSILVGLPRPEGAVVSAPEAQSLSRSEIALDDAAARLALRASNPDLFETLVSSGAADPVDGDFARAIQTELQRMGCYRSTIDGIWGGGSRSAVSRYFEAAGTTPGTIEPGPQLYREILLGSEVECAAVVAQPSAAPRTAPAASTRRTPAASAARSAPQPAAQPPAQQSSNPRINSSTLGTGFLR